MDLNDDVAEWLKIRDFVDYAKAHDDVFGAEWWSENGALDQELASMQQTKNYSKCGKINFATGSEWGSKAKTTENEGIDGMRAGTCLYAKWQRVSE